MSLLLFGGTPAGLLRHMVHTVDILRLPPVVDGKSGAAVAYLSGIGATPLYPLGAEMQQRPELESFFSLLEIYLRGNPDVQDGDVLVFDDVEYPVRVVSSWTGFLHLVVEVQSASD